MPDRPTEPGSTTEPIRLVMVEARPVMATGLREILDREPDIEVVGQVASPDEAQEVVDATTPDVVLIDTAFEDSSDGHSALRLRRTSPDAAYVLLGGRDDDASIIEAVAIGAMGHIAEVAQPAELVETIRRVALGDDPLQDELRERPDLLARVLGEFRDGPAVVEPAPNPLTPRETEVLQLVAMGLKNREIAERFEVAEQTVKNQLRGAMRHLGAPNRTQAVVIAMRNGWLPGERLGEPPVAEPTRAVPPVAEPSTDAS
jgi:two-component system response regulator DevR